jgi:hypothetical protein
VIGDEQQARLTLAFVLALVVGAAAGAADASARASATLCVGGTPKCYSTIQAAVDSAHDGDTIKLERGTFTGGVTIDLSVKLEGKGADETIISGGGPVLTIGVAGAPSEPTVTIHGVTVTGGVTVGNLTPFSGRGGGIYIPRAAGPSTGATVTIRNSVIRGNSVAPSVAIDSGDPCCPFADAGGGGISNDGTLLLDHTTVSDNRADAAAGLTSEALGAGILNRAFGNLTLRNSVVTDNHAGVTAPNGAVAEGGGIVMVAGTLAIDNSLVSNNSADVSASFPSGVETFAFAGGIHVQENASATIRNTTVSGNVVTATNPVGDTTAYSGGIDDDGSLDLRDSTVSNNRVSAIAGVTVTCGPECVPGAGPGGMEIDGAATIRNTRITGNSVSATSPNGTASAQGGGILNFSADPTEPVLISDSVISGNNVTVSSTTGSATVQGAGITNNGVLELRTTRTNDNTGTATGPSGDAQGGGIWNGALLFGSPSAELTVQDSKITHNTLSGSAGIALQGGGLFTTFPVTLTHSTISSNLPDNCVGVSC